MPRYVLWKMKTYISAAFNRDHLYYPWPTKSASPLLHRGGLSLHSFAENLLKVTLHRMHCYMKTIFKRDRIFGRNVTDSQSRHWLSCKSYDIEPECDDINVTQGKRRRADVQGILSLRTDCLIVERAPYTSVHACS